MILWPLSRRVKPSLRLSGGGTLLFLPSIAVLALLLTASAYPATTADLVRVIDGDTIVVDAHIWPGLTKLVSVRLRGVDTPELHGKCDKEKQRAQAAKLFVVRFLNSSAIMLKNVEQGKYAGRVVADVYNSVGKNLSAALLANNLGRKYNGGKRKGWCE